MSLVFRSVKPCSLVVTDVSKGSSAFIFRVSLLDCLFLRMKARYFETSVTNYESARCSVQKDLPTVTNTELSDVLETVNVYFSVA